MDHARRRARRSGPAAGLVGLVGLLGLVTAALPRPVDACSCQGWIRPRLYVGEDTTLPRDARGLPFHALGMGEIKALERRLGASVLEVPYAIERGLGLDLVVPEGGLVVGAQYTVTVASFGDLPTTSTVTIGAEAIALEGASLVLGPRRRESVPLVPEAPAGQCRDDLEADVILASARLPPSIERYREYLLYAFVVDGQPYDPPPASLCGQRRPSPPGRSRRARPGSELLFTTCAQGLGLAPGTHTVALEIATPDGRRVTSPPQTFELDCATSPLPEPEPPEPTPREPTTPEATTPSPTSPEAAGPPPVAAGCRLGARAPLWLLLPLLVARRRPGEPPRARRRG